VRLRTISSACLVGLAVGLLATPATAGTEDHAGSEPEYPHGAFSGDCSVCHGPEGWTPLQVAEDFDHAYFGFALEGAHRALDCTACHLTLDFTESPEPECTACHEDVHGGENGPDCASCHNARTFRSFNEMTRNHQLTRFPLSGAHRAIDCVDCHSPARGNLVYTLSVECVSCHRPVYQTAANPDHVAGGFPTDCESCHSTVLWQQARFDHGFTGFPLDGAHRAVSCESCHVNGQYAGTSVECVSCHQVDYDTTTNPNHLQSGFGTDCTVCHTTNAWLGGVFDHDRSAFPLTGAHRAVTCDGCHADGVYAGKSTACFSCHRTDYETTADPNHVQAGFPIACENCHTTTTWIGAQFDHDQTNFPLTGAHRAVLCQDCHSDGVYAGKNTACVSCHITDYEQTTDPNHRASGFSTACESCHDTTNWNDATFDHDGAFFPIYSGKHNGQWQACSDCHLNPSNYAEFECIFCHRHSDQPKVDADHSEQPGYRYDSQACYSCHPDGRN